MVENKNKQEVKRQKTAARERLTNWYMINMTFGFVGIIVLQFIGNGYSMMRFWPGTQTLMMDMILRIAAGVFFLLGAALFKFWFYSKPRGGLSKISVVKRANDWVIRIMANKNKSRFFNYAIFSWVVAAVALFISLFAQVRLLLQNLGILRVFWSHVPQRFIWLIMALIGVWLIIGLVYYIIKYRKI